LNEYFAFMLFLFCSALLETLYNLLSFFASFVYQKRYKIDIK